MIAVLLEKIEKIESEGKENEQDLEELYYDLEIVSNNLLVF